MEGKESKKIMCKKRKLFLKKCDQESHQISITILNFFSGIIDFRRLHKTLSLYQFWTSCY